MRVSHLALIGLVGCASGTSARSGDDGADFSAASRGGAGGTAQTNVTAPSCSGRTCGTDATGNSCGTCGGHQTCTSMGLCEASVPEGVACPPTAAVGAFVGKVVQPGSIPLAQGGAYAIESNCAKPVYILGVTETCSICVAHLAQWTKPGAFLDRLRADGVDVVLVSTDGPSGDSGSAATAEALRKRFDLRDRFILGYEPRGRDSFEGFVALRTRFSGARIALIIKPGNIIGAVGQVDEESTIRVALGLR